MKDIVSNCADEGRSLRIVLAATRTASVFYAPLGVPTPLASSVDVVNIWQTRSDDYLIV